MQAVQKYIPITPRKLRLVADAVRQLSPAEALVYLKFLNKRAATPLAKTIKSALANAHHTRGLKPEQLFFKTIDIKEGPTLKRWRAVSRGMAHPILKRTSHIVVKLEEKHGTKS